MPERILPGVGLRAFYDPGQRNWGTSLSEDLRRLSALVQPRATSRSASSAISVVLLSDVPLMPVNRAAEAAAPVAGKMVVDAAKSITFDDAMKILRGGDTAATEVGVKFTTDTFGYATGIRFYKASTNSGTSIESGLSCG